MVEEGGTVGEEAWAVVRVSCGSRDGEVRVRGGVSIDCESLPVELSKGQKLGISSLLFIAVVMQMDRGLDKPSPPKSTRSHPTSLRQVT